MLSGFGPGFKIVKLKSCYLLVVSPLTLSCSTGRLVLCNLHLLPSLNYGTRSSSLNNLKVISASCHSSCFFLGGDFNFTYEEEGRFDPRTKERTLGDTNLVRAFNSYLGHLVELWQDDFTRRQFDHTTPSVSNLSRIDRIYTNIPVAHLVTMSVSGGDFVGCCLWLKLV